MPFPIDIKLVNKLEDTLSMKLPDSFKKRMMVLNGGELIIDNDNWQVYPIFSPENRKTIKRTSNHILRENEVDKKWGNFPETSLSIADNGTGNKPIFMEKNADAFGDEVYFWDHETGETIQIATDFSEISDVDL